MRIRTATICSLAALLFIGAGCAEENTTDIPFSTYSVHIEPSLSQKETRQATLSESEVTLDTLMHEVGAQIETAPRANATAITKLNGVISTLSKEWHLYINNTLQTFTQLDSVNVHASDTIEWKYE